MCPGLGPMTAGQLTWGQPGLTFLVTSDIPAYISPECQPECPGRGGPVGSSSTMATVADALTTWGVCISAGLTMALAAGIKRGCSTVTTRTSESIASSFASACQRVPSRSPPRPCQWALNTVVVLLTPNRMIATRVQRHWHCQWQCVWYYVVSPSPLRLPVPASG